MLSLLLAWQALPPKEAAAVDLLRHRGADVRVEQPLEVWIDFNGPFKDDDLKPVNGLTSLTALRILTEGLTDAGIDHIQNVPRLWLLVMRSARLTDKGVAKLARIKSLKKLDFLGAKLTNKSIRLLYGLRSLEQLYLYGAKVDDAALRALAPMKQLKILDIPVETSDATFDWLKKQLPTTSIKRI